MGDLSEAVGDLAQASLTARSVEPAHGTIRGPADSGHTHEHACLNCGTMLLGSHCHACGQAAHVHRTLGAFFHDLLHGVFHFEGKIWRTLPMLAWRPGRLTREYIDGRRASYVSPIALFLFSVFLMFAAAGLTNSAHVVDRSAQGIASEVREAELALARTEQERARVSAQGGPTASLDARLKAQRDEVALLRAMNDKGVVAGSAVRLSDDVPSWLGAGLTHAAANPELFLYKIKNSAYKFSWALIPLSVPFLWLLFPFSRRFGIYDHTVFVTYSLTFVSLLAVVGMIAVAIGAGWLVPLLALAPLAHMFAQLRGTYALGKGGALWRTAALALFAVLAMVAFIALLLGMGIVD